MSNAQERDYGQDAKEGRREEVPRLRLLADLADAQASGVSAYDDSGNPVFDVHPGDAVEVVLDATGWAGGSAITDATWEAPDGGVISSRAVSGAIASCLVAVPDDGAGWRLYRVRCQMTKASGGIRKVLLWLQATRY